MFNPFKYFEDFRASFGEEAALKLLKALSDIYENLAQTVTKEEFNELKEIVRQQGENLNILTQRMGQLTQRVDQLTEDVRKLTQRVDQLTERMDQLTQRVDQLTEDVRKLTQRVDQLTERMDQLTQRVDQLTQRVDQLTEDVRKLTQRVDQLTERMDQLTQRVDQLTERMDQLTQRVDQLTEDVRKLTGEMGRMKEEMKEVRQHLGGLSITVGYTLENQAYKGLPPLLEKDYGLQVKDRLLRTFLADEKGRPLEVNIYGHAQRNGEEVVILGEAKAQLSKNDIDRFLRRKVKPLQKLLPRTFLVLVTHMISSPEVEEYARKKGIALYYSYELE